MIVEDEELIREGMKMSIDWSSYGLSLVAAAADGKEALELAVRLRPDIVLTDVVMKEMDGIELVRRLRADIPDKDIRVIMISGHEKVDYIKSALKLQVIDYLLKPFHEEELGDVLRRVAASLDAERKQRERVRSLERRLEHEEADPNGSDQRKTVRAVKEYIQHAFREELSLAQLAAQVHLSPNYLANLFKKETGVTLNDYITEIRLAEAKRLLRKEPGILVFDVAERIGYKDGKYFTKLFKREVGLNPSEYRDRV
jgi:two-component system response regulator YesN